MDDPKHIGRYEILGELGKGAMGKVYRAQDPNIGRIVALKTMRLDVHGSDDAEILRRFKHEAKLAGVLNHANIVTIYDAGEFDGVFYMAMEYLEGSTLQSLLHQQGTMPPERVVEIARQVCAGLDYAHAHQVIHRDVKPANIMITPENVVKIMDFGIAKSGANMTTTGQVLGTPTYMSPEQVKGKTLDGRSDLFSFGVVLYEMVVGEKPFTGQTITTIIYKIIHEPAIAPRELDVTVHPGLSDVIMKALEKNPHERYQTGAELVQALVSHGSAGKGAERAKVAVASAPAAPAASIPLNPAKPAAPKPIAAASTKPAVAPPLKPGEHTVGVGIRIGNKPLSAKKKPPAPAAGNQKMGIILGSSVLAVAILAVGIWQWSKAEPAPTGPIAQTEAPKPATAPAPLPSGPVKTAAPSASGKAKTVVASESSPPSSATGGSRGAEAPSAAAASIPSDKGNLQVTSDPAGAKATITGPSSANGTTPFTATNLEPGNYSISLSKAGYATLTRNVRVMGGRAAAIGADLKPETAAALAKLSVNSTPAGAEIFLDGNASGKNTPAQFQVAAGQHRIEVKKEGFQDQETTADLKSGESFNFAPKLQAAKSGSGSNPFRAFRGLFGGNKIPDGKGMVNLKSDPEGAEIVYNGVKVEKLTPAKFPMDPGTYKVIVRKAGYKSAQREFKIEKGKSIDVSVTLEKQ